MANKMFIAGDWGTTNLRLYLCDASKSGSPIVLDRKIGSGVSRVSGSFADCIFALIDPWLQAHDSLPTLLSGAIGSNVGWHEAPYLPCPVSASDIAGGYLEFVERDVEFLIVSGVKTQNPLGAADVMRGEELQILGWLRQAKLNDTSARLFALPGTHNKWVWYENGKISNFLTAYTGELYGLLRQHSILIGEHRDQPFSTEAFLRGVATIQSLGEAQLVHVLFGTRSKQLLGELPSHEAESYLSGLITGADVLGALKVFAKGSKEQPAVEVIGAEHLADKYSLALDHLQIKAGRSDPEKITVAGFQAVFDVFNNNR
ncbi:MAG: 2-dehydro-3-deoxygalactonokinase [Gammaproteobacteria bacterium]|nr:2-dehydro-3-deoxygalactonokinase [Gammaproteobacteria bacterium]